MDFLDGKRIPLTPVDEMRQHSPRSPNFTATVKAASFWKPCMMMFNEIIRAPREIGAVCPSSTRLANKIASFVNTGIDEFVVELGGGTGVITESLLRRGIAANQLIVIEKSALLAQYLSERFPNICVLHADAAELPFILERAKSVSAVVSCLPLRSLPDTEVKKIAATWARSLTGGGRVIQFTYAPFSAAAWLAAGLKRTGSETVWFNLPPARVEVFSPL